MDTTTGEVIDIGNKAKLYAKMARVMGKMNRVEKSGRNQAQQYDFATHDDVVDMVRAAMAEENLVVFMDFVDWKQEPRGEKWVKTTAEFMFTLADGETGETRPCRWIAEAFDNGDKGFNKVETAALKYFLLKTFLISTGDKADDADNESPDVHQQKSSPPKKSNGTRPAPPTKPAPAPSQNGNKEPAAKDASKVTDINKARETLGSGNVERRAPFDKHKTDGSAALQSDPIPLNAWASKDTIADFGFDVREATGVPDMSPPDVARLGLGEAYDTQFYNYKMWNETYETKQAALDAIKAAFEAEMTAKTATTKEAPSAVEQELFPPPTDLSKIGF